jgi:hypothetical protein
LCSLLLNTKVPSLKLAESPSGSNRKASLEKIKVVYLKATETRRRARSSRAQLSLTTAS